jgi:hypothetical protein
VIGKPEPDAPTALLDGGGQRAIVDDGVADRLQPANRLERVAADEEPPAAAAIRLPDR